MKFMLSWKISPGHHRLAGEEFLKSGAPTPVGLSMISRWHAPGSMSGWALAEANDLEPLYEHVAQWADLLEIQVTPVVDNTEAVQALTNVYGR